MTNEFGAPWIVMSFIPGSTISKLWFNKDGPTPLEDRRRRALESIAEAMSQLQKFQFRKVGSLQWSDRHKRDKTISIGPLYGYGEDENDDGRAGKVEQAGPFGSSISYILHEHPDEESFTEDLNRGACILNRMMLTHLHRSSHHPYSRCRAGTFVLSFPDFDSQNILIDEKGNLTGLIDWDNVHTYPRYIGYCRYPSFITRDWDPATYDYPKSDIENSPEELIRYRQIYLDKMTQLLGGEGDSIFVAKSHIFEALWIASHNNSMYRLSFMRGFMKRMFPEETMDGELDTLDVRGDLAQGTLEPQFLKKLEKGIKELLLVKGLSSRWSLSSIWGGFVVLFKCSRKRIRLP